MRWQLQLGPSGAGWLFVVMGVWLVVRPWLDLPRWLWPGLLVAGALWQTQGYFRYRRDSKLVGACVLAAWAAYAALAAYLPGLPWYLAFAFLGLGFLVASAVVPGRPQWPLLPGALLLAVATVFWILHVSLQLLAYLLPLVLILGGLWLVGPGRRRSQ